MLKTALCDLLGCEHPIIAAGAASVARAELVAAVTNAGGFGFLGAGGLSAEATLERIEQTRALTDRPFGVNLLLPKLTAGQVEACAHAGVRCVAFFWGDAAPFIPRLHAAGVLATVQVGSVEEALRVVGAGADFVIAQGHEAGGHVRGTECLFSLLPRVVRAIHPHPVVAAGGLADASGLVAALAAGAQAVAMGTRFVATPEAACHPQYKQRVVRARAGDTVYTTLFDVGWEQAPHRVLRNRQVEEWEATGCPPPGRRNGEGEIIGCFGEGSGVTAVPRYSSWLPRPDFDGDVEYAALYAGESAALVNEILPAAEVVRALVNGARRLCSAAE